jgi:hypothetical protein
VAGGLFFPTGLHAQFEGMIESENMTTEAFGAPEKFHMRMYVRADRVRIETAAGDEGDVVLIYRSDRSIIWMLNMRDSTYQELPHPSVAPSPDRKDPGASGYTIRTTEKTREILGYRCQQVLLQRGEEVTEIWGAKALGDVSETLNRVIGEGGGDLSGWQQELRTLKLFPLSAKMTFGGRVLESQSVTKVKRGRGEDRLFDLPARFRREAPVQLPGGLKE